MFRSSYESAPEQLRKCSGAVTKVFRSSFKSSGTIISFPEQFWFFRSSYKSSGAVIILPEQLGYADFCTPWHNYASIRKDKATQQWPSHRSKVTHICVGSLTIIGSDNDLSPSRLKAIDWTNVEILLIGLLGASFIFIKENAFENISKMAIILSRPQCVIHPFNSATNLKLCGAVTCHKTQIVVKKLSPFSNTTGQTYFASISDISFGPSMPDISSKLMYLTHIPTIQVWLNLRAIECVKTTWKCQ